VPRIECPHDLPDVQVSLRERWSPCTSCGGTGHKSEQKAETPVAATDVPSAPVIFGYAESPAVELPVSPVHEAGPEAETLLMPLEVPAPVHAVDPKQQAVPEPLVIDMSVLINAENSE
jgi:hypothetical protein